MLAPGKNRLESKDDLGIKLTPNRLSETHASDAARHRVAIRPIGSHRVISVCDSDDSRKERNIVPAKTIWISLAINPFVMVAHDSRDLSVVVNFRENPLANLRVLFHLPPLGKRKRTRLLE